MYSSTLSWISVLDRSGFLTPRLGRFTPGKENRYSLYTRLCGHQDQSGRVQKILPHRSWIPGRSRSLRVAIPTELSRSTQTDTLQKYKFFVLTEKDADLQFWPSHRLYSLYFLYNTPFRLKKWKYFALKQATTLSFNNLSFIWSI